jgi:hypothetical protein
MATASYTPMALEAFHWPGHRHGKPAADAPVYVPSAIALRARTYAPANAAQVRVTDTLPVHVADPTAPGLPRQLRVFEAGAAPIVRAWQLEGSHRVRLGGSAADRVVAFKAHGFGTVGASRVHANPGSGEILVRSPFLVIEARLVSPSFATWPRSGILDLGALLRTDDAGHTEPVSVVVRRVSARTESWSPLVMRCDQRSLAWERGAVSTHLLFSCAGGVFDLSPNPTRVQLDVGRGTGVAMCDGYVLEFRLQFGARASRIPPPQAVSAHWFDIDAETGGLFDGQLPVRRVAFHLDVGRASVWYDQEDCAPVTSVVMCHVTRKVEAPAHAPRVQRVDGAAVHDGTVVLSGLFETPAGQRHPLAFLCAGSDLLLLSGGDTSAQLYSLEKHA